MESRQKLPNKHRSDQLSGSRLMQRRVLKNRRSGSGSTDTTDPRDSETFGVGRRYSFVLLVHAFGIRCVVVAVIVVK